MIAGGSIGSIRVLRLSSQFLQRHDVLVAEALSWNEEGRTVVELLNPTFAPIIVHANEKLGMFYPVEAHSTDEVCNLFDAHTITRHYVAITYLIERFHLHSNHNDGHVDEQETCGYNSYVMAVSKIALSSYADALDIGNKRMYFREKNSINNDPYTVPSHELKRDILPPVQCTDIFNY